MADPTDRVNENTPGTYYVDTNCIDCDACRGAAPEYFTRMDSKHYSYVFRQPQTREEVDLCEQALMDCPVEAIGNDG
ncbi:MAG: ferredoxin [Pyrinomonadaceae bacterium]